LQPTVLIASTARWFSTARLAIGLANAGFTVAAVCPPHHPLSKTGLVPKTHAYNTMAPLGSLAEAIAATQPTTIVPTDDVATHHLHKLHDRERRHRGSSSSICALIESSLGAPENFAIVEARAAVMALAEEERVRVPKTEVMTTFADLDKWLSHTGLPTVLKADGTSGGTGVRVVRTFEEAQKAFRELRTVPPSPRTRLQTLLRQSKALVWPALYYRHNVVNAQVYVTGCDAISEVACWKGTVLAGLQFKVLSKQYIGGPASVLRAIDNNEMSVAISKVVRRLDLSGLYGFDFILEEQTGDAHLIEMNPRATQVGHLTFGPGRDLPAALYAAASGLPLRTAPRITENDTIALFPQEWIRNRTSAFLESSYHDVPWEQPELVRACVLSCPEPRVQPSQHEEWLRELTTVRAPRP
jgi:ATP-grasp domain/Phosphoribosylglycinamide synthetase, ATP-grasp (A) domain